MNKELHSPAILLRSYDLSETSLIIHWLSEEYGLIKTVVNGANTKKSKFSGTLDLYSLCEIHLRYSQKSDLHTLLSSIPITQFTGLRKEYLRLSLASYFGSLIEKGVASEQPAPELYDLLKRALNYSHEKPLEWKAVIYFEKELSRLFGYATSGEEIRKLYQLSPIVKKLRERIKGELTY